jgi:hypothetical protein
MVFSDAGSTSALDGIDVQQWNDEGAGGHNFSEATDKPVFRNNATDNYNFNPVVQFELAGNDTLSHPFDADLNGSEITTVVVYKSTNTSNAFQPVISSFNINSGYFIRSYHSG